MRLRTALACAAGSLALVITLPTSASAATGSFQYSYTGPDGARHIATLADPKSGECIDLPGATGEESAYAPQNKTDATAVVFLDPGCEGGTYYVMNPGKVLGDRLKLRSVVFS
ncbi:hypothetical protein A6P39_038095 [Streptomyces sp. FXJ1.172]|uniref:hypothetical protein n=1 Tax=Streptomyces sp. FXJ1.172 TaxID=710705 RepID=UPI000836AF65|nr:hypothetical protein [Streptomyces sp. FXJ1.172]WEO99387.1 hypothetical protein A6P39_038095 [Streptomyces sp. FXJ1.172]